MSEASTGKAVPAAGLHFYLLLLACLALFITCIGILVFHRLQQNETRSIEQNLAAIANLKVNEINRWNEQNRINAIISSRASSVAVTPVNGWSKAPEREPSRTGCATGCKPCCRYIPTAR